MSGMLFFTLAWKPPFKVCSFTCFDNLTTFSFMSTCASKSCLDTRHEGACEERRNISYSFLTLALDGVRGQHHATSQYLFKIKGIYHPTCEYICVKQSVNQNLISKICMCSKNLWITEWRLKPIQMGYSKKGKWMRLLGQLFTLLLYSLFVPIIN
jgi:hypothetical protein